MPQAPETDYDVFISYRHNDNKSAGGIASEGWVTEFVNHLTTELETMVKGKVSIYFDRNQKDGLLETHHVEDSLTSRLKALIFIPILSQTYCDTECYAWKNEFIPFLKASAQDKIGPVIKLHNGNVATRVLPICIHDLDPSDQQLVEHELNNKLRAINFVFRSAGVNRPLRSREDDPLKNLNHITYRDQINKVAQAVKEIINSVRTQDPGSLPKSVDQKSKHQSLLEGLQTSPSRLKAITVMPLVFKSLDPAEEYLSQGFAEDLFASLRNIKALRPSIQGLSGQSGGQDLNGNQVNGNTSGAILTGNMTIDNDNIRIQVRLLQSKGETVVWQGEYTCHRNKLFSISEVIILEMCESLGIVLKEAERQAISHAGLVSEKAIELFWKGRFHWRRRGNDLITSLECFQKATDVDPDFALAHAGIANACALLGYYEMIPLNESIRRCKESAMKALSIDPTVIDAYYGLAYVALCSEWSWLEVESNFTRVFGINPTSTTARARYKLSLTQIACNFEDADMEVPECAPHFLQAYALLHKGKFEEGLKVALIAAKKDPGSFMSQRAVGLCYLGLGYEKEAIEALTLAAQLSNRHLLILFDLISAHAIGAGNEEASGITEEVMERVNALPARINDFFFQT